MRQFFYIIDLQMQLLFGAQDSIYKIFSTLEKIQPRQTITLIINHRNELYQQARRGKQLKALLESKKIEYVILCKHHQVKTYCESVGLEYNFQGESWYTRLTHIVYKFFFQAKDFHLGLLQKNNYAFYLIGALELGGLLMIGYLIRYLLLPSAYISIKPNYVIEDIVYNFRYVPASQYPYYLKADYLTIPYYTGSQAVKMTHSWRKPDQINQTSAGAVTISNEMTISYTIKPGTRLVTEDGIVFKTNKRVTIPPATSDGPGVITDIMIRADAMDEKGNLVAGRANLQSGTTLLIKNLKPSFFLKKIIAKTQTPFSGGDTINEFYLTSGDIEDFKTDANTTLYTQKASLLGQYIKSSEIIPFKYNDLISASVSQRNINQQVGNKVKFINAELDAKLGYKYILVKDIQQAIIRYLAQRPVQHYELIDTNTKSLTFYNTLTIDYERKMIIIPTKISIIKGYDFHKDINQVKQSLINKVANTSLQDAQHMLRQYDNLGIASITMSPSRYTTLPSTKSRIYIDIIK